MKSNFDFLEKEWDKLYKYSKKTEKNAIPDVRTSYVFARMATELVVKLVYSNVKELEDKSYDKFTDYLKNIHFKTLANKGGIYNQIDKIKENGNKAIHWEKEDKLFRNSELNTKYLFNLMKWFYNEHNNKCITKEFDPQLLPSESTDNKLTEVEILKLKDELKIEIRKEIEDLKRKLKEVEKAKDELEKDYENEIDEYEIEIAGFKKENNRIEKENIELRKLYIDSQELNKALYLQKQKSNTKLDIEILDVAITEPEFDIQGRIFLNLKYSNNFYHAIKYFKKDKQNKYKETSLIGRGKYQNSSLFKMYSKVLSDISIDEILNKKYDNILLIETDNLDIKNSILMNNLLLDLKKQFRFQKGDSEYLSNGHYIIDNVVFMSIWTFKNNYSTIQENTTPQNGKDALDLLKTDFINYFSKPDFGVFSDIRIYPVLDLKRYYKI